ncbi:unnamed protein product [Phyllotreta striolata]|uniref:Ig-like domain-containing protein n=1 Tax=Phyllotreta striolata TaxID=444603 RepID=A0A9N9TQC3_PHYSR|nr:unnamed protein product [Phyllotreta striolata]
MSPQAQPGTRKPLINSAGGVKINRLEVPEVIRHGNPVILDCDFTLDDNEQDLVVKWFFNKALVYQWIPSTKKRPQGLGILKDRLNLEYAASVDANSIHRALHILKAGPDLSGEYTCSVSTLQSEDIETKSMLVLGSFSFTTSKLWKQNTALQFIKYLFANQPDTLRIYKRPFSHPLFSILDTFVSL